MDFLSAVVRRLVAIRFVAATSVVASLAALGIAAFAYEEPADAQKDAPKDSLRETLAGYGRALKNVRFTAFLVVFAGFYFMAEQFT